MKKIFSTLALSAIAVTAVSCSDDDKPAPAEQKQLLGKWNYIEELALDVNGNMVSTDSGENGVCPLDIYDCLSNGSLQHTDYDYSTNSNACSNQILSGTWSINANTFTLKNEFTGEEGEAFEIKKLNNDSFEIQQTLSREDAGNYELNVVSLKYIFKKVK